MIEVLEIFQLSHLKYDVFSFICSHSVPSLSVHYALQKEDNYHYLARRIA